LSFFLLVLNSTEAVYEYLNINISNPDKTIPTSSITSKKRKKRELETRKK